MQLIAESIKMNKSHASWKRFCGGLSFGSFWDVTETIPRLTSLIYAEKFDFENPTIMEDKQCKQMKRFSEMAKKVIIFCH